jgi:hypothetical protein
MHERKCDGVRRTREERTKESMRRYQKSLNPEPSPLITKAKGSDRVQCVRCGEKFPDAKALGIHTSRVHFAAAAAAAGGE